MTFLNRVLHVSDKIQQYTVVKAIRDGLVHLIPIITIGAFALIFMYFPIDAYQEFIATFGNGFILNFFKFIQTATFGVMSVYMTISISRAYLRYKADSVVVHIGGIFASLVVFFMLSGVFLDNFGLDNLGAKSMLVAIISGLGASQLYLLFFKLSPAQSKRILSMGADRELNRMLSTLIPIVLVSLIGALFNLLVVALCHPIGVNSFRELYIWLLNRLFSIGDNGFFKGFFFVLLSSFLWFFGVHGSDALEGVMQEYFTPGLEINMNAVAAGGQPTVILTKGFFDIFVLMGGCGAAMCLLIAILAFSKNKARKGLGITASVPMLFNINELMVFGLPIIFNPIMLVPFLLVPLVCYSISYLALSTGMVPLITHEIQWTTPIFVGGYFATGSIAGSLLQLVNLVVGVLIYLPFVKILDRESERVIKQNYEDFMEYYKTNERELQNVKLVDINNIYGSFAKELMADVRHDMINEINLYYQPQYDYDGKCVGVEALLRWKHPVLGMLYPPLIVKLMGECGQLFKLEEAIVRKVFEDREALLKKYGEDVKISVNGTGSSFASGELLELFKELDSEYHLKGKNICVELTEQEAFSINDKTRAILRDFKSLGVLLAIDDFSMGQTTLHYLKENIFDIIKIDGSLVKGLSTSDNCKEIVSTLIELADSLSLMVVAEFVETEEERELLHKMGCNCYQGYLYSPAVPIVEEVVQENEN